MVHQNKKSTIRSIPLRIRLFPFLLWKETITAASLRSDLFAGLTGAFIVLPQGVSFALIAGLPAEYGLYTAIITPIVAALFGSSLHLISGPTTAISITLFSTLSHFAEPGSAQFIQMAFTLTFLAGCFQLFFGLARLGTLINFVSHSVVVGFTAGAALLIATGQLKYALGIPIPSGTSFIKSWMLLFSSTSHINYHELSIAVITLVCGATLKRWRPKWPGLLIALIIGGLACIAMDGETHGVRLLGELPSRLPPLSSPSFDPEIIRILAPGALAVALLGLIEALSIARSIAVSSNQHINGNQEFIGQGLSNIVGSFFSAYAGSGSFTRSGVNYDAGAVTPLSGIFSALFLTAIILLIAPVTAWLPLSAMGAVILLVAFKLIDVVHIREILKSSRSESLVLGVTLMGTLLFDLEFAIYTGVLLSLALYLTRTSHPHVDIMVPEPTDERRRLVEIEGTSLQKCPQLTIVRINGSIFFGAANHITEALEETDNEDPKHLLIVGYGINFIDVSGALALCQEARRRRQLGKALYLCRINRDVHHFLQQGGFMDEIDEDHVFPTEYAAIAKIMKDLDGNECLTCTARIFEECMLSVKRPPFTGIGLK